MTNINLKTEMESGMWQRGIWRGLALLAILPMGASAAEPYVPEMLEPWREWVLHRHKDHACPPSHAVANRRCLWTSELTLRVDEDGASFTQRSTSFATLALQIPGDASSWPLDVKLDGESAVVTRSANRPSVRLEPGEHRIEGSFRWQERPEELTIPVEHGLLDLRLNGERVTRPQSDAGRLYLGERARDGPDVGVLEAEVMQHDGQQRQHYECAGAQKHVDEPNQRSA